MEEWMLELLFMICCCCSCKFESLEAEAVDSYVKILAKPSTVTKENDSSERFFN
jgi:hypothetical protein